MYLKQWILSALASASLVAISNGQGCSCAEGRVSLKFYAFIHAWDNAEEPYIPTGTVTMTMNDVYLDAESNTIENVTISKEASGGFADTRSDSEGNDIGGKEVFIEMGDKAEAKIYSGTLGINGGGISGGSGGYCGGGFVLCPELEIREKRSDGSWSEWGENFGVSYDDLDSSAPTEFQIRIKKEEEEEDDSGGGGGGGGAGLGSGAGGGGPLGQGGQLLEAGISTAQLDQPAPMGSGGVPAINQAGFASKIDLGKGILALRALLNSSAADASKLTFAGYTASEIPAQTVDLLTHGTHVVLSTSGSPRYIRQVKTPKYLADIQPVSGGGYEIRVYRHGQTIPSLGLGGIYTPNGPLTGTTRITPLSAQNPEGSGVRVSETGADGIPKAIEYAVQGNTHSVKEGTRITRTTSTYTYVPRGTTSAWGENGNWERMEETEILQDNVTVSKTQNTYVYLFRKSANAVVATTQYLRESTVFETDGVAPIWRTTHYVPHPNSFGKTHYEYSSDGSYQVYTYQLVKPDSTDPNDWIAGPAFGLLKQTLKSIVGSPPSGPTVATAANESNSESTTYSYSGSELIRKVTKRPRQIGVTSSIVTTGDWGNSGTMYYENLDKLINIIADPNSGVSSKWTPQSSSLNSEGNTSYAYAAVFTEGITSYDISYRPNQSYMKEGIVFLEEDLDWAGSSFGSIDSEGNGSITAYEQGTYAGGVFTPGTPGDLSATGKDVRATTIKVLNYDLPRAEEQERTVTIRDQDGRPYVEYLYVGGAAAGEEASTTTYDYSSEWFNGSPRETTIRKNDRVISVSRTVSDQETHSWDEQGMQTITITDDHGGSTTIQRGHGAQPDVLTTYAKNGRTTTQTTTAGGVSRTETTVVDLVGRVVSQTDASGATTTTSYEDHGRRTITTFPGNLQRIEQTDIEGRTVSVTGSAVVGQFYEYAYLEDGSLETTVRTGDSASSPRYIKTATDMVGRRKHIIKPNPEGGDDLKTQFYYYLDTNRLVFQLLPGLKPVIYATPIYKSQTQFTGHSVIYAELMPEFPEQTPPIPDDLANATAGNFERVTETKTIYEKLDGYWWQVSTEKQNTSVTVTSNGQGGEDTTTTNVTSISKTCLHGAPGGAASKSITIDPSGLTTTTVSTIDRAAKTLTTTVSTNAGTATAVTINVNGLVQSHKAQDAELPTTWTYDSFGQPLKETSPRGAVTQRRYYPDGKLRTVTDHANQTTTYSYYGPTHASHGQLSTITGPTGETTTYTYTPKGQIEEIGGTATYRVRYAYDEYGMKNEMWTWQDAVRNPAGERTEWVYQPGTGLLWEKKDADGHGAAYTYHPSGKIKTRTWERGVVTTYGYSNYGDLETITYSGETPPNTTPNVTFANFDRRGQPREITQTGIGKEILSYNLATGQLQSRHYDGEHTQLPGLGLRYTGEFGPDSTGRPSGLVETSNSGATPGRTISYSYYHGHGLPETVSDGTRSHTYAYHPNSSLIHTISAREGTTEETFKETRAYDAQARLVSIRSARAGSSTAQLTSYSYDYDELNRRTKVTQQDGSSWHYGYNSRSEVTSATRKTATGSTIPQLGASYAYDDIGNRKTSTSPILGDHSYVANSSNEYSSITTSTSRTAIGRAPVGWSDLRINGTLANRTDELFHLPITLSAGQNSTQPVWKDIVVNSANAGGNQPTKHFWYAQTPTVPAYDADGNLTNDGRWKYTWDAENRPIQMESTPAATAAGHPYTKVQAIYDAMGRRLARSVWQGGSAASPTFKSSQRYLYDAWNVISEYQTQGGTGGPPVISKTYLWGLDLSNTPQGAGGVGGLLSLRLPSSVSESSVFYPSYDGNGNITAWSQKTTPTPIARREYDAFGNTLVSEGQWPSHYGFSTKPQDPETGLYYYGYRYYDPVTGRWPSRDPIEERGGVNLYGFVGNNGVSESDYLGMVTLKEAENELRKRGVKGQGARIPGRWVIYLYTRSQIFEEWYRLEKRKGSWWSSLPKCPKKLCVVHSGRSQTAFNVFTKDPSKWNPPEHPINAEENLHPGTIWSMRSKADSAGHANQCTYDAKGILLRTPPASGTVDWFRSKTQTHYDHDVDPAYSANMLDGGSSMGVVSSTITGGPSILGTPGGYLKKYFEVRPLWAEAP